MGTVLLVEDDQAIHDLIAIVLGFEHIDLAAASSAAAALARLREGLVPCLILLDLRMPGMNGIEFHDQLQRTPEWSRLPVIVFSGDRDAEAIAAQMGAAGCLRKPVELQSLLDVVHRYCPH
jgi:CheY-like chemotaxis protein